MAHPQIAIPALGEFRNGFAGAVLQPDHPNYHSVRMLHNG
jgi:hypothetical protein